ncbi:MAG: hypothetical protein ACEPOZ_19625 [Marinifilaceae bacterium]
MKLKFFLLFLFLSGFCMAQNPKKHFIPFKEWHLPGTVIPSDLNTYTIKYGEVPFKEIQFVAANDRYRSHNHSIAFDKKKLFDGGIYKVMALTQFKHVPYLYLADIKILVKVTDLGYKVKAKGNKKLGSDKSTFTGELLGVCNVSVSVEDKQGNKLYETKKQAKDLLAEVSSLNNLVITKEDVAFDQIIKKYNKKPEEYKKKLIKSLNDNIVKLGRKVVQNIDFYIQSTKLPIYTIKKKKGYDFTGVNGKTKQFMDVVSQSYSDQYQSMVSDSARSVVDFWKQEMQKYDPQNKKDKKVLWSLLSNITSAYYIIGDYENAIENTEKLNDLNHRWNNKTIEKLAENRVKLIALHKNSDGSPKREYLSVNYKDENRAVCKENAEGTYFKLDGYIKGTLVTNDGAETEGYIRINDHDKVQGIVDPSLLNGRSATLITINKDGKQIKRTFRASNCKYIFFPGDDSNLGDYFCPVKCVLSNGGKTEYKAGNLTLEGKKKRFLKVIFNTKKIKVYIYHSEVFLQKPNCDYCESTSSVKFHYAFRKELAKFAPDCPRVLEKIQNKEYENSFLGICSFASDYIDCFEEEEDEY